jgi:F-type H+-transporting ATPase subunit gamma
VPLASIVFWRDLLNEVDNSAPQFRIWKAHVRLLLTDTMGTTPIQIDRHSLLPIDFGRFPRPLERVPPLTTLTPWILLERLAAEYVYAQLCEAAIHALEAENEARTMAMASAKSNIGKKLIALSQCERELRQEEITTEIVELAAGAEASQTSRR